MIKNADHIILAVQAMLIGWRHYNIEPCFDGVKLLDDLPSNYEFSLQGICTPDSEYKVDITKLVDNHPGFTVTNNGKIVLIANQHPDYFHRMTKVFPEYTILNAATKSVIYKSNENMSQYHPTPYTLEDYLEEDEHFQELMLYDMVQHSDINKILQIRNSCYDIMKHNKISFLINHISLDDEYDLKNTEIKDSVLQTIESEYPNFIRNYNLAKTTKGIYFNDIYNKEGR